MDSAAYVLKLTLNPQGTNAAKADVLRAAFERPLADDCGTPGSAGAGDPAMPVPEPEPDAKLCRADRKRAPALAALEPDAPGREASPPAPPHGARSRPSAAAVASPRVSDPDASVRKGPARAAAARAVAAGARGWASGGEDGAADEAEGNAIVVDSDEDDFVPAARSRVRLLAGQLWRAWLEGVPGV